MSGAKKKEAPYEIVLTPEQEALLDEGFAAIERGEFIEIELDDDDDVHTVGAKLRRALRDHA